MGHLTIINSIQIVLGGGLPIAPHHREGQDIIGAVAALRLIGPRQQHPVNMDIPTRDLGITPLYTRGQVISGRMPP